MTIFVSWILVTFSLSTELCRNHPSKPDLSKPDFSASKDKPRLLRSYCHSSCPMKAPVSWGQSLLHSQIVGQGSICSIFVPVQRSHSFLPALPSLPHFPPVLSLLSSQSGDFFEKNKMSLEGIAEGKGWARAWCPLLFLSTLTANQNSGRTEKIWSQRQEEWQFLGGH